MITEGGWDVVDASRLKGKPSAMPWTKYRVNRFFAILASLLFWRRITDLHSGMRAYRKTALDAMELDTRGTALPVELLLLPMRLGYKVTTYYIEYFERVGASTMNPFHAIQWSFWRIWRARFGKHTRREA